MICYKDKIEDPILDPLLKTINWYEPSLKYSTMNSIGGDFNFGGYGLNKDSGWDGFKICTNTSPILNGTNLKKGDILVLPSAEYDGTPLEKFDEEEYPILDNSTLKFYKSEIVGFDLGFRERPTCGTFMVIQKTQTSGKIINVATTDWCSPKGIGGKDADKIKTITQNMIELLLNGQDIFSSK